MIHVSVGVEEEYLTLPVSGPHLSRVDSSLQVQMFRGASRVLLETGEVGLAEGLDTALGPLSLPLGAPGRRHDEALLGAARRVVVIHPEVVTNLMGHHEDAGEASAGVGLATTVGDSQLLTEEGQMVTMEVTCVYTHPDDAVVLLSAHPSHPGQAHRHAVLRETLNNSCPASSLSTFLPLWSTA